MVRCYDNMREIDQMLNQWILNSIIKDKLRKLIIKAIENAKNETLKK